MKRIPVSKNLATENTQGILMYYCLNVFRDNIFYHESQDVIVLFKNNEDQIDIFDIISKDKVNIIDLLSDISGQGTTKVVFHFTPDYEGVTCESRPFQGGGTLFVKKGATGDYPTFAKHPITSEA